MIAAVALAALAWSFLVDTRWLLAERRLIVEHMVFARR